MAIVTTYVCDVTGKTGESKDQFVDVSINSKLTNGSYSLNRQHEIKKLVHIDVAEKLGLLSQLKGVTQQPEVTFEGKLKVLLEDFVQSIVEDNLANQ